MSDDNATVATDRESVHCTQCAAEPGQACLFPKGTAPTVVDNGIQRRVVHAARYAMTLPPDERSAFWESAVERYLSAELALMDATNRREEQS